MLYLIGVGTILGITMRILQAGFEPGKAQKVVTVLGVLLGLAFVVALVIHWYAYSDVIIGAGGIKHV